VTIRARCIRRSGKLLPLSQVARVARSSGDRTTGGAVLVPKSITLERSYVKSFLRHYTSVRRVSTASRERVSLQVRDGRPRWLAIFAQGVIGYRRAVTTGPSTGWRSSARGVRTGSQNHESCFSGAPTSFVAPLVSTLSSPALSSSWSPSHATGCGSPPVPGCRSCFHLGRDYDVAGFTSLTRTSTPPFVVTDNVKVKRQTAIVTALHDTPVDL
jgi:hypothetical protein